MEQERHNCNNIQKFDDIIQCCDCKTCHQNGQADIDIAYLGFIKEHDPDLGRNFPNIIIKTCFGCEVLQSLKRVRRKKDLKVKTQMTEVLSKEFETYSTINSPNCISSKANSPVDLKKKVLRDKRKKKDPFEKKHTQSHYDGNVNVNLFCLTNNLSYYNKGSGRSQGVR
ncbi:unnamed protein product [Moneuplotes crassus]|uniref:Uncharacterized protein n=1 Tax=Euplotes crassus TaxID=5936 RepID=A0AAD1XCF2_EUPCR|nr:unnamed protein product [Moneuplotes crassus]